MRLDEQRLHVEAKETAYEDAIAHRYNRDYHASPIMRDHDEDFVAFVQEHFRPGDRVLDLGCGPASLWHYWGAALAESAALIGVDLSPGMVEEARNAYPTGDFRIGSHLEIPVPSGTIDLVIASSTLHHLPDTLLPGAFAEISRVMAEHATLVGREPVGTGRIADRAGWLSGAVMTFRHLVYRLTRTKEVPEPAIGDHHHAYDPKVFLEALAKTFAPRSLRFRQPFSPYVGRCEDPLVAAIARWFDVWLKDVPGHTFHYAAMKNFADAADVARCVRQELATEGRFDREEFLARLQVAAELLERELERKTLSE
jgi:SAM-dependent methyltransferase